MSCYIGVDIGGSKIAAGLVKDRRILVEKMTDTPHASRKIIEAVTGLIDGIISEQGRKGIKGIGIGAAGFVDRKGKWISSPNIPSVRNMPLKSILEKRFRKKVVLNNDANCFALEEALAGEGKGRGIVFGLILGTGTGGGIVIDSSIIKGADFIAGEVGHMPYLDRTFEDYCSGRFIKKAARKRGLRSTHPADVADLAEKGNRKAAAVYNEFGKHVGMLACSIIGMLNPDVIVLGGGVSRSYNLFSRSMKQTISSRAFFSKAKKTSIRPSKKRRHGLLGAALLAD